MTSAKNDSKGFNKLIEQMLEDYLNKSYDDTTRIESIVINRIPKKKKSCCWYFEYWIYINIFILYNIKLLLIIYNKINKQ